ncbi:hypothetical protein Ahy_B05g078232 [Arachis hypogaea]|uniref:Uncharacterized protein n=1 Tax=Arachis hypogaea TaxID=3818 RepID=A0A444Z6M0_ARAHY|nr:hypothetical protein Ahy_B05g078232 [Arachis hypogaea]
MGLTNPFKVSYTLYAIFPIIGLIISFYFVPLPFITFQIKLPYYSISTPLMINTSSNSSGKIEYANENSCDYSNGKWVRDERGPLYNGTSKYCKMKKNQNCIANGRPNTEYLYWRWKPNDDCNLPRFDPSTFLQLIRNRHVAFVGDSVARNQIESLICMLGSNNDDDSSKPKRLYHKGSRKWNILSHNANLSFYWSPFLVRGDMRSQKGPHYNTIYLDHVNERWARDLDEMDMIVISLGHWFDVPSIYYEGGSISSCLKLPQLGYCNHHVNDFYDPLRQALRVALNTIIEAKATKVRTYSPSHFEGEWNKGGTCLKDKPYEDGEKKVEGMDAEIRRIEMEEVEIAKEKAKEFGGLIRLEIMDVTKLALLRPDGHPGPYMNPFPFASKIVQNDCVHWCLPGPIDTWNEILLEIMKKLVLHSKAE